LISTHWPRLTAGLFYSTAPGRIALATFLLKTEPSEYSFADLQRDGSTAWHGITSNPAQLCMRSARRGDRAFIYHTGSEKSIVGLAEIVSDPYPDPTGTSEKHVAFDIRAVELAPVPLSLQAIRSDPRFAAFGLVKQTRLSVMPVPADLEVIICQLTGLSGSSKPERRTP